VVIIDNAVIIRTLLIIIVAVIGLMMIIMVYNVVVDLDVDSSGSRLQRKRRSVFACQNATRIFTENLYIHTNAELTIPKEIRNTHKKRIRTNYQEKGRDERFLTRR
jgi:hypothetical protein